MLPGRSLPLLAIAVVTLSCEPEIANPSGSCRAPNSGARAGYHAPSGDQWLPDCQNPLRREYWRVFATSPTAAYTIPRLDGHPALQPACTDAQHQLAGVVRRYGLCSPATSTEDVERI